MIISSINYAVLYICPGTGKYPALLRLKRGNMGHDTNDRWDIASGCRLCVGESCQIFCLEWKLHKVLQRPLVIIATGVILKEVLTPAQIAGIVMVLLGVHFAKVNPPIKAV